MKGFSGIFFEFHLSYYVQLSDNEMISYQSMNRGFQIIAYESILDRLANQKGDVAMFSKNEMYDSITGMYYVGEKVLQTVFDCAHGDFRLVQKAYWEMRASLEFLLTGYLLASYRNNECQYETEYGFDTASDAFDEDLAQSMCLARKYRIPRSKQ